MAANGVSLPHGISKVKTLMDLGQFLLWFGIGTMIGIISVNVYKLTLRLLRRK
jgi:hypothetical protein